MDWLEKQADQERRRTLHGDRPSVSTAIGNLLFAIAKLAGWLLLLVAFAVGALYALTKVSTEKYVLECQGKTSSKYSATAPAKLYMDVTEYGGIIGLWNKDFGSAQAEIPGAGANYFRMKKIGTMVRLEGIGGDTGLYSPLSRHVKAPMLDGAIFEGGCSTRSN